MNLAPVAEVRIPHGYEADGTWRRSVRLRPWSGREELGFEQRAGDLTTAAQTTWILAECLDHPQGAGFARALVAGDRVALLLHLRRLTLGETLACVVDCVHCGSRLDLELSVSDLLVPPYREPRREHETSVNGALLRFRIPNGEDLETCAELFRRDETEALRALLRRCVEENQQELLEGSGDAAESLAEEMAVLDPQAELRLDVRCALCTRSLALSFDVASFVLEEIRQRARRLVREVHSIASTYHWSEAEILGLPEPRRREYLSLIAARPA